LPTFLLKIFPNFSEKGSGLLCELNKDVSAMAVGVDEVIFHEHLKESAGSKSGDDGIEWMPIALEVCYRHSFNKAFNENGISGFFLESLGEVDIMIVDEMSVEGGKIVFLYVEIYLVDEGLLERVFSYWNFIRF
jgi:hypothetical protein